MDTLVQDIRYAARQLLKTPGFALTAVLTLALGIGVTVTVISLVRQVLLSPLPYPQPERLVSTAFTWPDSGPSGETTGLVADFTLRNARSFSSMAVTSQTATEVNFVPAGGQAESIQVFPVSHGYFETLGVQPALGRAFSLDEDRADGPKALVLSYGFWQREFGGDRSIIGHAVHLNGESVTVAGVMPAGFRAETRSSQSNGSHLELASPDAWVPLRLSSKDPAYGGHNFVMFARLKPGITPGQAQAELATLQMALYAANPFYKTWTDDTNRTPAYQVWPYAQVVSGGIHTSLLLMAWAAGAVLLLTCLNLAGFYVARALQRASEFSLRSALGAPQSRLLRLALLEVLGLALMGSVGAVLVSRALLPFLLHASPVPIPQLNSSAGIIALAFTAGALGLVCALLFGAPLALLAGAPGNRGAAQGQRTAVGTRTQTRLSQAMVVTQIGLALVLLSVSTLLLGTFLKLRSQPLGFNPQRLTVFQANLKGDKYTSTEQTATFVNKVLDQLRAAPGVSQVGAVSGLPFERGLNINLDTEKGEGHVIEFRPVTPDYLRTVGMPILQGRNFTKSDEASGAHVALISEAGARHLWPGKNPLGQTLRVLGKDQWVVIGVMGNAPQDSLAEAPPTSMFVPSAEMADKTTTLLNGWFPMSFVVRSDARLNLSAAIRKAVVQADVEVPVNHITTMNEVIDHSVAAPRFFTEIAEGFAAFAVLLTAIGIFGLLNYHVTQRTREIGVRMALGASRGRILRGILGASASMAIAGAILGCLGAMLLRPVLIRWLSVYVVGLQPSAQKLLLNGAETLTIGVVIIVGTAFIAALLPARRAAHVEPMEALRAE